MRMMLNLSETLLIATVIVLIRFGTMKFLFVASREPLSLQITSLHTLARGKF